MDEQDVNHLNADDKNSTNLILLENKEGEKLNFEDKSESQLGSEVYVDQGTENEVITIVTEETEGEVYIYDENDIDNVPAENSEEYIQVCDSSNTFDEVNNSEEKVINVDEIEEEEENIKKNENEDKPEEINLELEIVKGDSAAGKGSQPKNFKNILLEDWEVEVPHTIENHEPDNFIETVSKSEKPQEMIPYSSENCNIVVISEEVEVNEHAEEIDSAGQNEHTEEVISAAPNEHAEVISASPNEHAEEIISAGPNEHAEEIISAGPKHAEVISAGPNEHAEEINSAAPNEHAEEVNTAGPYEQTLKENSMEVPKEISAEDELQMLQNNNIKEEFTILKQNFEPENSFHNQSENSLHSHSENANVKDVMKSQLVEKRLEALKCAKSVTKEEIVKILDDSSEKVIRPIVGGKDLFFSIELTKRLNQKLSPKKGKIPETGEKHSESDSCNNNNTVDDRQKLVEILESDEIKDWKSIPSKSGLSLKENGNDMEISKAIKSMEEADLRVKTTNKTPRKTPLKKVRTMDKELERTLALQQLREEFPCIRKRSRTTKKVNHIPFLASTVLEKAMTSPEVTTALKLEHPRRRPCYLPDNVAYSKSKKNTETVKTENKESVKQISENGEKSTPDLAEPFFESPGDPVPNPVVKTYSVKKKSTDTENDIKTTLEAVAKALNERSEDSSELKPKKQKTVTKENKTKLILIKKKRKLKAGVKSDKKMKSELEKLLEDEGAVRMLYETQHAETTSAVPKKSKFKTTTGLKKDLVMKTKLVKNAVMRLSGVGTDGIFLRGKRRSVCHSVAVKQEEKPLFSSTPNIVLYKPKKKQRAEASRILYRHSSSESFESSEGYRRTSFDSEGLNVEPAVSTHQAEESKPFPVASDKTPLKKRPKKSEILKKRLKNVKEASKRKAVKNKESLKRLSTDSVSAGGSKLNLSNVPVRKSSRPRVVSKKYSVWSSTSMDSLSVESLGIKKLKKASTELGKSLNCKELTILQYEHLVQIILTPTSTIMKNSLNCEVLKELVNVLNYLSEDESCTVVLLSSRGNTFCQGVDINGIISFNESEKKKGVSQLIKAIREFVLCLAKFEKPVVAGVQGAAVGLGVTLLPYCDLIISSDTASFYTPYVKLGQAPEGAPIHTFPHFNRQLVSELLFKSHKLTAVDALKLGLVTQVIPEEKFEEDLIMISRNMASQPVQGMKSIKVLLKASQQRNVAEALQEEGQLLEEQWNSSECVNNMIKFLNSGELQLRQKVNG